MKNVKWWCTCAMAIVFGMLVVVSCHDKDDDPAPEAVSVGEDAGTVTVKDNSESNEDIKKPEDVEPEEVVEDQPLSKVEIEIPGGAIDVDANVGLIVDDKVNISVTTFVPAPEKVTTEVKPSEENKEVEKSIPLAAAHFEPSGLQFKEPVTISIPNPIPGVTFAQNNMLLTYLNPTTGNWDVVKKENSTENVEVSLGEGKYMAPVLHFSAYAIENKVTSTVSKETVLKTEVVGQANRDNSENPKAVSGIVLKYTEKSGWEYEGDMVAIVKQQLGASSSEADTKTVNAMVAYLKTRMFSLMGSVSGIASTERTYNTVNVNGYTKMDYACYPKASLI